MMIMYQRQQLQITHRQIILDINKVPAKLRQVSKGRRKKRRVWVKLGRTKQWWINLWAGVLGKEEWYLNLRLDRAAFIALDRNVRPLVAPVPRNFRADAMSVENKVAQCDIVFFERSRFVSHDL